MSEESAGKGLCAGDPGFGTETVLNDDDTDGGRRCDQADRVRSV